MISRVKGTHDLLDADLYTSITCLLKDHLSCYAFTEIATPIIESVELFKRSLGTETDVVHKEMFMIQPRGEDKVSDQWCLRPEGTAPVMRAFLENKIDTVPWKVFAQGPMFRYERPQKGRYRQFHQTTIEVIGGASVSYDVELIVLLDRYFRTILSLDHYSLLINSLGCMDDRMHHKKALLNYLLEKDICGQLCTLCQERTHSNTLRVFDCKNSGCQELYKNAPFITHYLCDQCAGDWRIVQDELHLLGVSYVHKPSLVRGLDYYNKTVFEFVSDHGLGSQTAFCAGGRYDRLALLVGADRDYPSCGAALGLERLLLLCEPHKDTLIMARRRKVIITPLDKSLYVLALIVADTLRTTAHLCIDIYYEESSIKSMMRKANKEKADFVLIIGENERATGTIVVKNMVTGVQSTVKQKDVVACLMMQDGKER